MLVPMRRIIPFMPVAVRMSMTVVMLVPRPKDHGARQVHDESDHRHQQRLVVGDRARRKQPLDRLPHQPQGDERKQQRAGIAAERAHLAGAEGEARVGGMPLGIVIGEHRHAERGHVRAHVPTVGGERHRTGEIAEGDLEEHGHEGERHHPRGAAHALPGMGIDFEGMLPGRERWRGRPGRNRKRSRVGRSGTPRFFLARAHRRPASL